MIFDVREEKYPQKKYVVYVWEGEDDNYIDATQTTYSEEVYNEMNQWCKDTFHVYTRTAYNIFEFKKFKYLQWFLLKWS